LFIVLDRISAKKKKAAAVVAVEKLSETEELPESNEDKNE